MTRFNCFVIVYVLEWLSLNGIVMPAMTQSFET